jgi:predicted dehydrogenase
MYIAFMKTTTWGIIGPGKIANKFATALGMVEGARLGAIASRDAARGREFALRHGVATVYDDYALLAADPAIDAIYVATPHGFHAEHSLLCLRHAKAVLCEKPLALNAREAGEMIAAAREHRAFLMEAMWTRFVPLMLKVMDVIGSGHIGEVKYIRADFGFFAAFDPNGRLFNIRLGGGSLLDIGIYPLFLCIQLLGEPETITAYGRLSPTGSDETCHAILGYANGATAVVSSTLACQTSLSAEIAGTQGMIRIDTSWYKNHRFEWNHMGEAAQVVEVAPLVNGFEYQIREVMQCLDKGLIESPALPHSFSMLMARTMDAIRGRIGVRYLTDPL